MSDASDLAKYLTHYRYDLIRAAVTGLSSKSSHSETIAREAVQIANAVVAALAKENAPRT